MGLSNQSKQNIYVNVAEGKLHIGKEPNVETFDTIDGYLESITDFTKRVGDREKHAFQIVLKDSDSTYVLESGVASTFSKMFAGCLGGVTKGEAIRIRVKPNDREPKATSCFVEVDKDGEWVKAVYHSFKGDETGALSAIRKHGSYKAYQARGDAGKAKLFDIAKRLNLPSYEDAPHLYQTWATRVLKSQSPIDLGGLNDGTWQQLAGYLEHHLDPQAPLPKEFRVETPPAPAPTSSDEYDPFADE